MEADYHIVTELHRRLGIDPLVTEPSFVGASIIGLLPRSERPAVLSLGFFPLPFSSPDTAPFGSGRRRSTAR